MTPRDEADPARTIERAVAMARRRRRYRLALAVTLLASLTLVVCC